MRTRTLPFAALIGVAALLPGAPAAPAPAGEWLAGDLHVHTTYSHDSYGGPGDELESPEEIYTLGNTVTEQFAVAAARGLDYLAITDHNDLRSTADPGSGTGGVIPVPGYENSLDGHAQMPRATEVYARDRDGDGDVDLTDVEGLASVLRDAGGAFQINHPIAGDGALDWGLDHTLVPDTVEVWNISPLWQHPAPSSSDNDLAVRFWEAFLDAGHQVAATGGSDNHYKATIAAQGPGQPTTWVLARERSAAGVLEGLAAGRTTISWQPPNHGGPVLLLEADANRDGDYESTIGDTVPARARVRVHVTGASAPARIRIVGNGGRKITWIDVTGPDFTAKFDVPRWATWVRAELLVKDADKQRIALCEEQFGGETSYCRNRLLRLAMTSPIYLAR